MGSNAGVEYPSDIRIGSIIEHVSERGYPGKVVYVDHTPTRSGVFLCKVEWSDSIYPEIVRSNRMILLKF